MAVAIYNDGVSPEFEGLVARVTGSSQIAYGLNNENDAAPLMRRLTVEVSAALGAFGVSTHGGVLRDSKIIVEGGMNAFGLFLGDSTDVHDVDILVSGGTSFNFGVHVSGTGLQQSEMSNLNVRAFPRGTGTGAGVWFDNTSSSPTLRDSRVSSSLGASSYGIHVTNSSTPLIVGVEVRAQALVSSSNFLGVYVSGPAGPTIRNVVADGAGQGMRIESTGATKLENSVLAGDTGLFMSGSVTSDTIVFGNRIDGSTTDVQNAGAAVCMGNYDDKGGPVAC